MKRFVILMFAALGFAGTIPPSTALGGIPRSASDTPAAERNADAFADYTVGVFLLESGSAQAAIPHLESAWEKSSHDLTMGEKLAEAYFTVGDLGKCDAVLNAVLVADPSSAAGLLLKAKVAYLQSRKEEAVRYLEKLEATGEPSFEVERILATIYSELGMKEKALASYAKALRIDPNHPLLQYQNAVLLRESGRGDDAEKAFEEAIRIKPDFSEAALGLAELLAGRGNQAQAESVLVRLLQASPSDYAALEMMTNMYVERGEIDRAIKLLEAENRRSPLPDEGLLLLGRLYYEAKDYEASLAIFEKMLENGEPTPDLARVLGEICSKGGKKEKALQYYRKAISLGPDDYRNPLALFFSSSETFTPDESQRIDLPRDESLRLLGDAARTVPSADFDGLYLLGISYESVDSLETAREYLSRAIEIRPADERVTLNLASVLEKLKRYEEAERYLVTLHEKQPEDPTTCNFYGYLLALMGKDLTKAEELVRKALGKEPQNGYYIDSLGWVFFKRGAYERAVQELEKAAKIVSDDPTILEHLGDAYAALGRYGDALGAYEKSKTLQDDNPEISRKIDATRKKAGR